MLIIGLTGSIGMGKSTAAERFLHHGIAVFDADAAVHDLYRGEAVPHIESVFPGTTMEGAVNRQKLTAALLADTEGFAKLEAIVHPLVRVVEGRFLQTEAARGAEMAVLEIPLLFETGADKFVDIVVVVSTDAETQAKRVLERSGMTREKLAQLMSRQLPDAEKRARADFVVETGGTISQSHAKLDSIIESLHGRTGLAYQRHWA